MRQQKSFFLIIGIAAFSFILTGLPYGKFSWNSLKTAFGAEKCGCYGYDCSGYGDPYGGGGYGEEPEPGEDSDGHSADKDTTTVAVPSRPQIGMIQINDLQAQPAYAEPGGEIARDASGAEIWLPQDADDSFSDTYVVMGTTLVGRRTWVEISLGANGSTVWVPLNKVTALEGVRRR